MITNLGRSWLSNKLSLSVPEEMWREQCRLLGLEIVIVILILPVRGRKPEGGGEMRVAGSPIQIYRFHLLKDLCKSVQGID